jgi:hypothetical protein
MPMTLGSPLYDAEAAYRRERIIAASTPDASAAPLRPPNPSPLLPGYLAQPDELRVGSDLGTRPEHPTVGYTPIEEFRPALDEPEPTVEVHDVALGIEHQGRRPVSFHDSLRQDGS